jgi:hypothetical protein
MQAPDFWAVESEAPGFAPPLFGATRFTAQLATATAAFTGATEDLMHNQHPPLE